MSIIDTTCARKIKCVINEGKKQECMRIGANIYTTEGRTKVNITLDGSLVLFLDVRVGDEVGQEAIWGWTS